MFFKLPKMLANKDTYFNRRILHRFYLHVERIAKFIQEIILIQYNISNDFVTFCHMQQTY